MEEKQTIGLGKIKNNISFHTNASSYIRSQKHSAGNVTYY